MENKGNKAVTQSHPQNGWLFNLNYSNKFGFVGEMKAKRMSLDMSS